MQLENFFNDVYQEYLVYAKKELKSQSYDTLIYDFEKHILPFFSSYRLKDISSKDIYKWEENILSLNYSNNFNKKLYYHLSGFFNYCKKFYGFDKTIISNVGCFKNKYEKKKYDFYSIEEFKHFIKYVYEEQYKQFFNLMFYTGTRPGEAMALKFSDINGNYITIDKTINSHKKREIGTPKTNSSNRKIIIDNKLKRDIKKLYIYYKKKYGIDYDFYVFGGMKPLSPTSINRRKEKACKLANLRQITLHQFRHSHATFLINRKIMIHEISNRLGHSNVSTTLDIYTHSDLAQEKRVQNTLNSIRYNPFATFFYKIKRIISYILKHLVF